MANGEEQSGGGKWYLQFWYLVQSRGSSRLSITSVRKLGHAIVDRLGRP